MKRCPPKCFSSLEMPFDMAGCVIPLARGCVERSRLGDCPGIPYLDAQAFGHNPTSCSQGPGRGRDARERVSCPDPERVSTGETLVPTMGDEEECVMRDLQGVADTLFIPLVARIHVSRRFPEYFYDEKAMSLENFVPGDGIRRSSSEYMYLASVARYRNLDRIVREFAGRNGECNVVNLGAGLETAAFRLADCGARFYEIDLPEVIEAREKVIPKGPGEVLIGCDVLSLDWLPRIDSSIPTLFMASGVFQYFREDDVIGLARKLGESLPGSELVFDATDEVGVRYANRYVKKTGNTTAPMNFYINDPEAFARACGAELLEQRPFFKDMEPGVRRRLKIGSRIAMMVADRKRRTIIVHLKLLGRKS